MSFFCCSTRRESDDEGNVHVSNLRPATPTATGGDPSGESQQQREQRELEMKGVTLRTQIPKLSDEEKALRDTAITKYRRRLAREEQRKRREEERAARAHASLEKLRARLDDPDANFGHSNQPSSGSGDDSHSHANNSNGRNRDDDALSVQSNTSMATTLISESTVVSTVASSRAVYGRATYAGGGRGRGGGGGGDYDTDDESVASADAHSIATSRGVRGNTAAPGPSGGGVGRNGSRGDDLSNMNEVDKNKYHRRRQRRRHPNRNEDADGLFNQWEMRRRDGDNYYYDDDNDDDDDEEEEDGDGDGNYDSADSLASSVARPPEEVLATAGLDGAAYNTTSNTKGSPYRELNYGAQEQEEVFVTGGGSKALPRKDKNTNSKTSRPPSQQVSKQGSQRGSRAPSSATRTSDSRNSPATAGLHNNTNSGGGGGGLDDGGGGRHSSSGGTSHADPNVASPLGASRGGSRNQTPQHNRKKKWTGKDVENNVAMSGFFASPDHTAGYGLQPMRLPPSLAAPAVSPPLAPTTAPLVPVPSSQRASAAGSCGSLPSDRSNSPANYRDEA